MKNFAAFLLAILLFTSCKKGTGGSGNSGGSLPPGEWNVAAGAHTSYILKSDHTVWASGSNIYGEFGNGNKTSSLVFIKIQDSVKEIYAGGAAFFFTKMDNSLWAAGEDGIKDPVSGTIGNHTTPIKILTDVKKVSVGKRGIYLAIKNDNTLWGWGRNFKGALGGLPPGATTSTGINFPVKIADNVSDASAGFYHTIFAQGGGVYVMGDDQGQLGDLGPNTDYTHGPVRLPLATSADIVVAGLSSCFAGNSPGVFYGLGDNDWYELGVKDTLKNTQITKFEVAPYFFDNGPLDFHIVTSGGDHITYIYEGSGGSLYACGYDYFGFNEIPIEIKAPRKVFAGIKKVACDGHQGHSIFLGFNNEIYTFGANPSGELGDGTKTDRMLYKKIDFQ